MRELLAFGHQDRLHRPSPLLRTMVGDVLRRTRLEQGRTLCDVAASARISMQYLSELERGRKEASSEILAALCAALRLDLSELLAAVGRDLFERRAHRSPVVRLDAFRDGDVRTRADVTTPEAPLLPAEGSVGASSAPDGLLLDGSVIADRPSSAPSAHPLNSRAAVCQLAA
jgi:transcriptional regulator with XRE-family HTH domain